jgi:hypothetical protein
MLERDHNPEAQDEVLPTTHMVAILPAQLKTFRALFLLRLESTGRSKPFPPSLWYIVSTYARYLYHKYIRERSSLLRKGLRLRWDPVTGRYWVVYESPDSDLTWEQALEGWEYSMISRSYEPPPTSSSAKKVLRQTAPIVEEDVLPPPQFPPTTTPLDHEGSYAVSGHYPEGVKKDLNLTPGEAARSIIQPERVGDMNVYTRNVGPFAVVDMIPAEQENLKYIPAVQEALAPPVYTEDDQTKQDREIGQQIRENLTPDQNDEVSRLNRTNRLNRLNS